MNDEELGKILKKLNNTIDDYNKNINYNNLFKDIDNSNNPNEIYEKLINKLLNNIYNNATLNEIKIKLDKVDDIMDNIQYNFILQNSDNMLYLEDEASSIVEDLIAKIYNKNQRTIELPVKLKNIIEYSIFNMISNNEVKIVIILIILELAIIDNLINS